MSRHLKYAKQTYYRHFRDSIKYCKLSLKASFYFFIHSICPDIYTTHGSNTISELHDMINLKYEIV